MPKVRIVQLLCPQRHCVLAAAYEAPDGTEDTDIAIRLHAEFNRLVGNGVLNPWCGLCGSLSLRAEDSPTPFATMEEAAPHLYENERQQLETSKCLKASKN